MIGTAKKQFHNEDVVGVLLNMDNFTLAYFMKGEKILTFSNPGWKVSF
jgi:hypothetical protein